MEAVQLKQARHPIIKVDAKQAAKLAFEYFNDLFPGAKISNPALEEVELLEDENCWLITLGFDEFPKSKNLNPSLQEMFGPPSIRKYKVFKVNARTGKVISMRIRKLE